ncbi:helicase associated domain-containing protein, partial [Streptomyces sp. NPDC006355]|uniref:helicase associated domain-containing protein n=1 Tax=Streptomyces sp. NPDC006355 TaxID=3156758 RepID=UPI0033BAE6CE
RPGVSAASRGPAPGCAGEAGRSRPVRDGPAPEEPTKPSTAPVSAFERGVAALAQYKARTGSLKVPRTHVERLEDGTEVKLGVFLSNTKTRRAKLSADKLQQLADLGLDWATA